ncbi:hypothetical protein Taro_051998 [Colocasia esculenta]|uniref:Uncharacterized protein n=1 Tax=Colocasia esculenta TaxID=4460 RepID=A0A843XHB1_COLES|nr:hypothetical protein [Colocasia esculenta]
MAGEGCVERPLFGGAVSSAFSLRFQDLSNIRDVPDHQAFADPSRDESIIFELLDLKHDVGDEASAAWFLRDLAAEQDAESSMVRKWDHAREIAFLAFLGDACVVEIAFLAFLQ